MTRPDHRTLTPSELRFQEGEDARRKEAARRFLQEVRKAGNAQGRLSGELEKDVELLAGALVSFADEWRASGPRPTDYDTCRKHGTYLGDGSWCGACLTERKPSLSEPGDA